MSKYFQTKLVMSVNMEKPNQWVIDGALRLSHGDHSDEEKG